MSRISKALERAELERLKRQETVREVPVPVSEPAPAMNGSAILQETSTSVMEPPGSSPLETVQEVSVDERVLALFDPRSPVAEQYRILRTNLLSLKTDKPLKALMLSSSLHAEGKSVSAVNLAVTLANDINQRKVLLIDADLRAGTIHQLLGVRPKAGLSEVLSNGISWREALVATPLPNLMVLGRGVTPPHPAELLSSNRLRQVIAEVRAEYDICLIDTPPIVPLSDPGIIGKVVDGAILVVRGGKTQRTLAQYALSLLTQANVRVFGCLLTHAESHIPEYIYRYF